MELQDLEQGCNAGRREGKYQSSDPAGEMVGLACCTEFDIAPEQIPTSLTVEEMRAEAWGVWWFVASCFTYSCVGILMLVRCEELVAVCPYHFWHVEAALLLQQGVLAFLNDAYFFGVSRRVQWADRVSASFLSMCQPFKFISCSMDFAQSSVLSVSFLCGVLAFAKAQQGLKEGSLHKFLFWHTCWHWAFPIGGALWIELAIRTSNELLLGREF